MARSINIKAGSMKGFNNLIKKLEKALPEVAEDTVKASCMAIEADAKHIVHVDTGRLRDSISTRIENNGDEITGVVYTDVEYAKYNEFGSSRMSAIPFMKPAFDKNKDNIENYFVEKLKAKVR